MKNNYEKTFLGSIIALILGTSCCWLTTLAVWLGGATIFTSLVAFFTKTETAFIILAVLLFLLSVYQFYKNKKSST
jgi:membrane protein implicated in regulation of membrane protease activity